jgi:hypothetical protein
MENIFLSYHFDERVESLASNLKRLIASHNLDLKDGTKIPGGQIINEVSKLVTESDAMIVVLTKRDHHEATNEWVRHERTLAYNKKIPFIALIEEGLEQEENVFKTYKHILFSINNISDAIIQISETINEWKILLGERIEIYLEPHNVAEIIRLNDHLPELVRYRFFDKKTAWSDWKDALIKPQAGGVSLIINGVSRESEIQIQVRTNDKTWKSDVVNRNLRISVS